MFRDARAFNKDISPWDVSSVTSMYCMFYNADAFNNGGQALDWGNDTTNVTTMESMFQRAQVFNVAINDWDTDSVTNFTSMFNNAPAFNQDIGDWDVSSATSFWYMFYQGAALEVKPLDWGNMSTVCAPRNDKKARLVILDRVTDPHNVGAILRSAEVFGARAVIATARNSAPETGALAKTASGALERQPILQIFLTPFMVQVNLIKTLVVGM